MNPAEDLHISTFQLPLSFYEKSLNVVGGILEELEIKPAIEQLKLNNQFINENHENLTSKNVPVLMEISNGIIDCIAAKASHPFIFNFDLVNEKMTVENLMIIKALEAL